MLGSGPGVLPAGGHLSLQVGYPGGGSRPLAVYVGRRTDRKAPLPALGAITALCFPALVPCPGLGGVDGRRLHYIILSRLLQTQGLGLGQLFLQEPQVLQGHGAQLGGRRGPVMRGCCLSFSQEGALGLAGV